MKSVGMKMKLKTGAIVLLVSLISVSLILSQTFLQETNYCFIFDERILADAKKVILNAHEYYDGFFYYHWNDGEALDRDWNFYNCWMDDVFYMSFGGYDMDYYRKVLVSFHKFTLMFGRTPSIIHITYPQGSNMREYGAFLYPIMVWNYWRFSGDYTIISELRESMLLDYNFMVSLLKNNLIYLDHNLTGMPDWVYRSGYLADMNMYFLFDLKIFAELYNFDINSQYSLTQDALIDTLWNDDLGFFIDWIDVNGIKHEHFQVEQLIGVFGDIIPEYYQQRIAESLPLHPSYAGKHWFFHPYPIQEMVLSIPDWNYVNSIRALYFYIHILEKFNRITNQTLEEILSLYESSIRKYGFIDTYNWANGEYVKGWGFNLDCDYIFSAGAWLAIKNLIEDDN